MPFAGWNRLPSMWPLLVAAAVTISSSLRLLGYIFLGFPPFRSFFFPSFFLFVLVLALFFHSSASLAELPPNVLAALSLIAEVVVFFKSWYLVRHRWRTMVGKPVIALA